MNSTQPHEVKTVIAVYYISILIAIVVCYFAPTPIGWALALLVVGWIGGLTFALVRRPAWFFDWIAKLP